MEVTRTPVAGVAEVTVGDERFSDAEGGVNWIINDEIGVEVNTNVLC